MNGSTRSRALLGLALMLSFGACAATQTSESTGQYIDDTTITTKVKTRLLEETGGKVVNIHVETNKGTVQLSGFVDSPDTIEKAVAVARRVEGVRSVDNDLHLR